MEAADGVEALEAADTCARDIHLLITDYEIPRMDGLELARRLRAKHERLRVLFVFGYDIEFQQSEQVEQLRKPYSWAEFVDKVRELLRRGAVEA